ncbi:ATP-dependent helicase [Pseudomonas aeruginosa]|uniref:ATP-dependent helicase n=1 Tax=Pseudomonas aeruginosa TaxID=287 RepID=UPI0008FAE872|nr:ATP-dependent helicase [Pseudomonas aeruginosa]EKV3037590.1 ATP-dependent helicase [Pseudomonas aeruginosa]EKV3076976.1 ATP-dependent helicase [Pseudomonas aeruginosa]EKW2598478.1 ATP-dependent helicase [Pseudomonas aeruginosa]MBG5114224.1 ATP-dependent helicase [Pseudomonas aeruginosa]MBG5527963.1 ATP-dependent helicase [Pseudomonas aeruginosa]
MTGIHGLTAEQEAFAAHVGGAFVHACPGAGKTRTIIARLARIAATLPPRCGVAVLSFTNSAVDEFRERCQAAGLDSLLKHPSFMGTLDAFVRHFVVLPSCAARSPTRPIILDSWDTLGIEIRLSGQFAFRGDPVSLDLFDPETNIIDPERIGHAGLQNHVRQHQVRYQQTAAHRRRGLLQAGYMSAGDARVQMLRLIRDPVNGGALGRAMAARFHEVMVDEGQDCNPLDLQILSWLRAHGVHVTFVCDPDQAIYEFRNGNPAGIQQFKETYPVESHRGLTGNFRSSPAVCRLAATLRNAGQVDEPVGDTANVEHPVLLLTYGGRGPTAMIGQAFLDRVTELGLDSANAIILAHSGKVAQRAVGAPSNNLNGSSRIESLARKVAEFWSPAATARSREAVLQAVETTLLDLMELRQPNEHLLRTVERLDIDRRAHRRRSLSFLMSLPKECGDTDADRLAWIGYVHEGVERLELSLPAGMTVRSFFRRPTNAQWSNHLQIPTDLGLKCAKIHEVKGREYGAVCVVVPPNRAPENRIEALFDSWELRADAEAKRVLYVGLTRAKHLGALAVPVAFADRCAAVLIAGQVPYTRRDL